MTQSQLIKRMEELERELNAVKRDVKKIQGKPLKSNDFIGMFHGDDDFKRAMELGAAYRRAQNPHRTTRKKNKKFGSSD